MSTAEEVMLEGEVRQQPTMPVTKETNMKKKLTMKKAIMARPKSGGRVKKTQKETLCTLAHCDFPHFCEEKKTHEYKYCYFPH